MGKPKFSSKKYVTPSHPWQADRIKMENELVKKYGLKNKREIWKAETALRKYRGQARELLAKLGSDDPQTKKESSQLLMHLIRLNILPHNSTLDDVLALETESILSRRLQTLTYLKGLASTPNQARQLISHGHVAIGGRKVTVPSYRVKKDEEADIEYVSDSPLSNDLHPARPRADFKPISMIKDKEPEKLIAGKSIEKIDEKVKEPEPVDDKEVKKEIIDEKPSESEDKTKSSEDKPEGTAVEEKQLEEKERPDEEKTEEKTGEEKPDEPLKEEIIEPEKNKKPDQTNKPKEEPKAEQKDKEKNEIEDKKETKVNGEN